MLNLDLVNTGFLDPESSAAGLVNGEITSERSTRQGQVKVVAYSQVGTINVYALNRALNFDSAKAKELDVAVVVLGIYKLDFRFARTARTCCLVSP